MGTITQEEETTMEITVNSIGLQENPEIDKMDVQVSFYKQIETYGFSAEVTVWIPKRDAPILELRKEAIQAALDFLKEAQAAHSA